MTWNDPAMDARKNPEYLRSLAQAVEDFHDALDQFLELHVRNDSQGGLGAALALGSAPAVFARNDADLAEIARRRSKVSRAAGRAADAVPLTRLMMVVQGWGEVNPILNWETITRPKPLLEAPDVLGVCDQAVGTLEGMILRVAAERPPSVGTEAMHPTVWNAASALWRDGHFREAVAASAEAVVAMVKIMTQRNDIAATSLWQDVFSEQPPRPGKSRLRWTGKDMQTMNAGLRLFAPGVQMTIRNPVAHGAGQLDEQTALEQLATLSLLARWVEACELVTADGELPSTGTASDGG